MLLASLLVSPASASAYYFLDSGTRAIGRGGAFVAGADDLSAQYYNPAALGNIERPMINLNGWAVQQVVLFDRADEEGQAFEPVTNEAPPILEPSGGFAAPLGGISPILENTTFAFGLYVPTSPYMAFPTEGPQRYALQDSLIWQIYAGPSLSQKVLPWLTVGAGLQYTFLRVEERLAATTCLSVEIDDCEDGNDDPNEDINLDLKSWDPMQWSWNAGLLIQPTKWLDIGASVQPPIKYEAPGSLGITFSDDFSLSSQLDGTSFEDDDITLLVTVPLIVRAGVQVKPVEGVRIEAAGTWTDWSSLQNLTITDMDMVVKRDPDAVLLTEDLVVEDDIVFETGYQDSFSVRLGGDFQTMPWLKTSAGLHYESSGVPAERQGVNLVDGPKWGFGLGGQFTIAKRVGLDLSFAEQFIASRTIENSELRQQSLYTNPLDPTETAVTYGKVVGNGEFSSNLTFVAIGATVYLGKPDTAED